MRQLHAAIGAVYIVGAIVALCEGGDPIGDLHPISLRPIFIVLGSLLMIGAFAAIIATKDERQKRDRAPNNAAANPAIALWLIVPA